jgi:Cu2+-exporting ATPase
MLITNLLVAGSVAYAGVKTVVTQHKAVAPKQTVKGNPLMTAPTVELADAPTDQDGVTLAERRHRAVATTSFWLAVGGLLFPTLTVASVPLTIYSTIPVLEAGCRSLYAEGRVKPSVVNSILLVSTLVSDHYLPAAAIAWLHHTFRLVGRRAQTVSEQMTSEVGNELSDLVRQAMGAPPRTAWIVRDTVEVKLPFDEVQVGDVLVVNRGEFVPVAGVVTTGSAKVNLLLITRSANPVEVAVGDRVYPTTFVMEGRLHVQVEKLRTTENA